MPNRLDPRYLPLKGVLKKLGYKVRVNCKYQGEQWPLMVEDQTHTKFAFVKVVPGNDGNASLVTYMPDGNVTIRFSYRVLLSPMAPKEVVKRLSPKADLKSVPAIVVSRILGVSKRKVRARRQFPQWLDDPWGW